MSGSITVSIVKNVLTEELELLTLTGLSLLSLLKKLFFELFFSATPN